jgi:glucosyl-3-phosphoglycerate phosphatase
MPETVLLIRHAQSTFNAHYAAFGVDPGHIDARLSELGLQQVEAARETLAGTPVDLVVVTPLTRALQTAQGLFGDREVPVHVTCLHRERLESSCDVGRSPVHLARDFPHLAFDHLADPWWHAPEGHEGPFAIEPENEFRARVDRFRTWVGERPERRVAVIGHGTFFHALTGRWLANAEAVAWDGWFR